MFFYCWRIKRKAQPENALRCAFLYGDFTIISYTYDLRKADAGKRPSAPHALPARLTVCLCKLFSPSGFCLRQKPLPSSEGGKNRQPADSRGCPYDLRKADAGKRPSAPHALPARFAVRQPAPRSMCPAAAAVSTICSMLIPGNKTKGYSSLPARFGARWHAPAFPMICLMPIPGRDSVF